MSSIRLILMLVIVFAGLPAEAQGLDAGSDVVVEPGGDLQGALDQSFKKMALIRNKAALRHFESKDYPAALQLFKEAWELDSENPEIVNNLGYLFHMLGNEREARHYYEIALKLEPDRYVAHINLADLLTRKDAGEEALSRAAQLLIRARELKGNRASVMLRQARVAAFRGRTDGAERFYEEYIANLDEMTDQKRLELGDFYRDSGQEEKALEWYRGVVDTGALGRKAAKRIWKIEVERQARKYGWVSTHKEVPDSARVLATRARIEHSKGHHEQARLLAQEALELAPHFAEALIIRGDVLKEQGNWRGAELSYLKALAVEHSNGELHARLGELYVAMGSPVHFAEGAFFLEQALQLKPEWTSLRLKLARAHQASGNLSAALMHINRFLAETTVDKEKKEALELKDSLVRLLAQGVDSGSDPAILETSPVEENLTVAMAMGRARAHMARGELDAAMAVIDRLPGKSRTAEVLALEARILHAAGNLDEAAERLAASLKLNDEQPGVHEQLGQILASQGRVEKARQHFLRAEQLGDRNALFHLARLDFGDGQPPFAAWVWDLIHLDDLLATRARLEAYLEEGRHQVYAGAAAEMKASADARLLAVIVAVAVLLLLAVAGAFLTWLRIRGGHGLMRLIQKHPESGPEVQRVLSAIRHEVLKHNTMVLTGLVEAVEAGEDPSEKATRLHSSLFGSNRDEAVLRRLLGYKEKLEQIGRQYGVRLNLAGRDPAISSLLKGFELLERVDTLLFRMEFLPAGQKSRMVATLREASNLLNVQGYQAIVSLLDELRLLEVDGTLLGAIFRVVAREPAFASHKVGDLRVMATIELPVAVAIPRQAFEDIFSNLFRNAIDSSVRHLDGEVLVGVHISDDIDEITGLANVVFRVLDCSPQQLTTEMIRGRFIEGGLGIAADLVSKFEGSLDVQMSGEQEDPGQGWAKAVVLYLPSMETKSP